MFFSLLTAEVYLFVSVVSERCETWVLMRRSARSGVLPGWGMTCCRSNALRRGKRRGGGLGCACCGICKEGGGMIVLHAMVDTGVH